MLNWMSHISTIPFKQRACPPLRTVYRWVTPGLLWGLLCLFGLVALPVSADDDQKIILAPEPGEGIEIKRISETEVQLIFRAERELLQPQGTIGDVDVGELSPLNTANYAWDRLRVRIFSPSNIFPRYRITARAPVPPDPDPNNLSTTDIGFGVQRIRACNPLVNPQYDYDPRSAVKDIDDIPQFQGTVGTLMLGAPGTEMFRTTCRRRGRNNFFDLYYAIGPQFFTPGPTLQMDVTLTLELLP